MRLSVKEKNAIIEAVSRLDPDAMIYLFGSRVDGMQKGGDIDILIFSNQLTFKDRLKIKAFLFEKVEEQKIDLVIAGDCKDPFVRMVMEHGIRLK